MLEFALSVFGVSHLQKYRQAGRVVFLGILLVSFERIQVGAVGESAHPNIVFILADDMGYGDLKVYNRESKIPAPHLDKLASEGLVFTDAHAGGSTCKPSRYALMTGRFAARMRRNGDRNGPLIQAGRASVASVLREEGYRTAMVGKWHLGFDQKARKPGASAKGFAFDYDQALTGGPMDRGFDSYFGMHASLDIPPYFFIRDRSAVMAPTETVAASTSVGEGEGWNRIQGKFWREGGRSPDFHHVEVTPRFAGEACRVIEDHVGDKPLFLYLALPSPHTPWLPTEEFVGKSGAGLYGDFMMQVDSVVGQVMASLQKAGLSENTLLMFSSDNGPVWYEKDAAKFGHRSTGPLRGAKGSVWEGGHRVPFIARWPARIKAGTRSGHTVSFVDVFATCAEIAGRKSLSKGVGQDSESFLSILLNPERSHVARPPILHGSRVIRDDDWKLIATKGSRGFTADRNQPFGIELYNLKDDLSEQKNLADSMPHRVSQLRAKIGEILGN